MDSVKKGNLEVVKYLIEEAKVDVHKIDSNGNSPLMYSATYG